MSVLKIFIKAHEWIALKQLTLSTPRVRLRQLANVPYAHFTNIIMITFRFFISRAHLNPFSISRRNMSSRLLFMTLISRRANPRKRTKIDLIRVIRSNF